MSIEAMKRALEALERLNNIDGMYSWVDTEQALRQAIEQAEKQEPVAWVCEGFGKEKHNLDYVQEDIDALEIGTALYTAPTRKEFGNLLMKLHEKYKHQHNHFHVEAVNFWEKNNG